MSSNVMDAFSVQSPCISLSEGIRLSDIYERQSRLNNFFISFFDFESAVLTADTRATGVGEEDKLIAAGDAVEEKEGAKGVTQRSRPELSALDDPNSRVA
jgi:hypothetical protein